MTAPLKPCPFCGGAKIDGGYNEYGGFVSICANCDTYGPPAAEMSKDAIIEAWNTRADAPELTALVAALRRQSAWVRSALDCEAWRWDADQREIAESEHADAVAALSAYEALQ